MSRYTVTPEARQDLKDIYRYIARENPPAAGRLRQIFSKKFRTLADHPLLGNARDDLAKGLRISLVGKYVILYRAKRNGIQVVQVVHSARDIYAVLRHKETES